MDSRYHIIFILTSSLLQVNNFPLPATHSDVQHGYRDEHILHGSGLSDFPSGPHENVLVIDFIRNNFKELKPHVFYHHKFYNLRKISLRSSNLSYIHPKAFSKMSDVVQVDLFGNKLSIFDKGTFEGLESLRHLHLAKNKIRLINEELLEPLHSLQVLDLSHNFIIKLPKDLLKRSSTISELKLESNHLLLEERAPILESATLTLLNLKSCNLDKISPETFSMLPRLEKLYLSRNHLKVLPDDLLTQQAHLKYLDISFNSIKTLTVNTFHIPTNLRALHCYQNPLESGLNCTHFLDVIRREEEEHHSNGHDTKLIKEQMDSDASAAVPDQEANTPEEKITGGNMGLEIPKRHDEEELPKRHEDGVTERTRIKRTDTDPYFKPVSTDSTSVASHSKVEAATNSSAYVHYSQNDTTVQSIKSMDIYTNILIYAIIGAGVICLILVSILLCEVLYIVKK